MEGRGSVPESGRVAAKGRGASPARSERNGTGAEGQPQLTHGNAQAELPSSPPSSSQQSRSGHSTGPRSPSRIEFVFDGEISPHGTRHGMQSRHERTTTDVRERAMVKRKGVRICDRCTMERKIVQPREETKRGLFLKFFVRECHGTLSGDCSPAHSLGRRDKASGSDPICLPGPPSVFPSRHRWK